ncbi:GTPase-activating protein GYP6 [Aspergillus clavatus NRRL 1]|uniref:Rab-GAP TBC domain-containing protein n=1 Tax=Aspergillus clavatus (strain ATCC 1007 / CBS 513.65 / DSM 816 / NCTC 3887 / NRRL 1 / QM 1276 / 107) TaxID=344612 RepID=A1CF50_ASPCL|nr:uncharacterized protein ACLA_091970 [Aspergillus clavatus NRRL 1]EAW11499.1 conserved hypothetical protein [Aspergillus clavatus NRRL 1]
MIQSRFVTPTSAFLLFDDLDRSQWSRRTSDSRDAYTALKAHYLKYIEHPDDLQSVIDPLADDEESPWQTLRQDEQMRADISQDVDRCLQENFFFREPATKAKMLDILFIYAKLNPDLGYRQGMHELLAPILWVIDRDAIDPRLLEESTSIEPSDELMLQLLQADWVEHDSFALFCSVMQTTRVYYEHKKQRSANGQIDVIPIVNQCQHIHQNLLTAADLELADHLQALEILPQIFLTRWMRLLFGREFPFQDILELWDLLFAEGLRSELIEFICVAMLLRIRWQLLSADYSGALTILLRYPSPEPHSPQSFVQDGLYLEQNPTSERGMFLISKYSGKPADSSRTLDRSKERSISARRFNFRNTLRESSQASSPSRSPARSSPISFEALLQDFSDGLQRRTESWGVAKAVRGAVTEARKNMQAIQSDRLVRTPLYDAAVSAVDTKDSSRREKSEMLGNLKAELQSLHERNRTLAKTLSQSLDDIINQLAKLEGSDKPAAAALRQALTGVQSVQASLEDPSSSQATVAGHDAARDDTPLKQVSEPMAPLEKQDTLEQVGPSQPLTVTGRARVSTRSSGSSIEGEIKAQKLASSNKMPSARPLRHTTRPSLADSEFSWMLGGNRHLSSFVSPISAPPEQTRHGEMKNKSQTLFGNEDGEPRFSRSEPDGLALRSFGVARDRDPGGDDTI